jgi:hypothetical protein
VTPFLPAPPPSLGIRDMMRKGKVKAGQVKMDGKLLRPDGTRFSVPSAADRRAARRKAAKRARVARRRNRG